MAKIVYLQECFIILEAKKEKNIVFFLILANTFSGEWSHLAVSYGICNFLWNLVLYLVLITRCFPENYESGTQAAVTRIIIDHLSAVSSKDSSSAKTAACNCG